MIWPAPPHWGQVCTMVKNPWLRRTWPRPPHARQVSRPARRGRAGARAALAALLPCDRDGALDTAGHLLEAERDRDPEVRPALGADRPPAGAAEEPLEAEDVAQDVGEVAEYRGVEARERLLADAAVPEPIVLGALLGVREDGVGLGGLLEALLGLPCRPGCGQDGT